MAPRHCCAPGSLGQTHPAEWGHDRMPGRRPGTRAPAESPGNLNIGSDSRRRPGRPPATGSAPAAPEPHHD
eukprot:283926-Hanusia_phi.AAC.2